MQLLKRVWLTAALLAVLPAVAWADGAEVLPQGCGTGQYGNGSHSPTMDPQGRTCVGGGATASGGSAATPSYTATSPGARTIVPLDVATVTTGGTAVTALNAGHATAGGFIVSSNAAGICVSQLGAAGTATAGNTVCVAQNQIYTLVPNAGAVSVNSTASGVALAGEGLN